jgi:(2R)-sulfolactate sulfo-lyase subunit alpha
MQVVQLTGAGRGPTFGKPRGIVKLAREEEPMIHFVVHDEHDSVGVVVVEGVKAGDELAGWIMDQDKELKLKALNDIPIGHKLAIAPLANGDTVIKYGVDIGRTVSEIKVGQHAHVHNIKTKRW